MAESPKRRRLNGTSNGHSVQDRPTVFPGPSSAPATTDDKKNWNGFCEIESEPVSDQGVTALSTILRFMWLSLQSKAFFNVILKELGVRGVKVQEVVSLEPEMLELLPYVLWNTEEIDALGLGYSNQRFSDGLSTDWSSCSDGRRMILISKSRVAQRAFGSPIRSDALQMTR